MTLKIKTVNESFEDLYDNIIDSLAPGTQFIRGPIILPLKTDVSDFELDPEELKTPFTIEADPGDDIEIFINNNRVSRFTSQGQDTVRLILVPGRNFIFIRTRGESQLLLVIATNYATFLRGWARSFYNSIQIRFDDAQAQLNSKFSLRTVEHQIAFQDLLSPVRTVRILTGKLAVKGLINETGNTRGVDEIMTAASNTTPVVIPTQVSLEYFEPGVYTLFSTAHDFGGFEFHIWIPNICTATWAAFVKLADNLPDDIMELVSVSDQKVCLKVFGITECHTFDFEQDFCSITSIITRLLDCFASLRVFVTMTVHSELAFCMWRYPFDVVVDLVLGRHRFDTGPPLDESPPLLFDSREESDPYSPDGWVGTPISDRFDGGHCLDTMVSSVVLFEDLDCCFTEPASTLLGSALLEVTAPFPISATAFFNILPSGTSMVVDATPPDDVLDGPDVVVDGS